MTQAQKELLAAKIKSSALNVGDWIGGWQSEPIGPIESFELRGRNLNCIVNGKNYPVSEVYFCPNPDEYEQMVTRFREFKQEHGTSSRNMKESPEERQKRLELEMQKRAHKKALGRAKSGRTV
jgi:hypothetical protein